MSTSHLSRKTRGGQTWPGKARGGVTGNSRDRPPQGGAPSGKSREGRLFGSQPNRPLDQKRLTFLFSEQSRLSNVLRRQARLARLDVAEVVSVQAEQLRQINSAIAAGFDTSRKDEIFKRKELTSGQVLLDRALGQQGAGLHHVKPDEKHHPGAPKPMNRRYRGQHQGQIKSVNLVPHEDFLNLRGPLLRDFSRAKDRGYKGPPSRWLRGPAASSLIERLRQKGMIHPLWTGELSLFERYSPLHWSTAGRQTRQSTTRHGYFGELLCKGNTATVESLGQARAVQRLPKNQWPCSEHGRLAWPTFPTFDESWEMVMRGKYPESPYCSPSKKPSNRKRPTRQIRPGSREAAISSFVLGIRASVVVPGKFLAYFKYRWGFLILRRNHQLPIDLTKFLSRVWKRDHTKMFLVHRMSYNEALRRIPDKLFYKLSGWTVSHEEQGKAQKAKPRTSLRNLRRSLNRRKDVQTMSDTSSTSTHSRGAGYGSILSPLNL